MDNIKLKKTEKDLLFFDNGDYFYQTFSGYTFLATLKDGKDIECFVYKLKNLWHVNDNIKENEHSPALIAKDFKTRKEAISSVIKQLSNVTSERMEKAIQDNIEQAKNRKEGKKNITDKIKLNEIAN